MDENNSTASFSPSNPDTWASLLTLPQVSKILNVSVWSLRHWDKQKRLIAVRLGKRKDRRYRKEDVLKVLNIGL